MFAVRGVSDTQIDVNTPSDFATLIGRVDTAWDLFEGAIGLSAGVTSYQKIGDVHVKDYGDGFVRMWGVAASVNSIVLPVEVRDIAECDIHVTTRGTSERHIHPRIDTSTNTLLGLVRIGNTGASFGWSVYGEKS